MRSLKFRYHVWAAIAAVLTLQLTACGGTEPIAVSFDIDVVDRTPTNGSATFSVKRGDTVTFNVTSDENGELHLHGYDLRHDVGPDEPLTLTFEADATGHFALEMHTGAATEAGACDTDPSGMSAHLAALAGDHEGHYDVSIETVGFVISEASDNHWHLYSDGELIGMYAEPTVSVDLGTGMHDLVATLSDASHCELPVSDTLMVGEGRDHDAADDHDTADEHAHKDDGVEFSLGTLDVLPR